MEIFGYYKGIIATCNLRLISAMSIPSVERKSTIVDNSLVISIDSKLRQPELAQQDGELDLRGLFAAMDDVMIVLDRDGTNLKILSTNSSGLA